MRYGLTKNIDTYNPVKVAFGEYGALLRDVRAARGWRTQARGRASRARAGYPPVSTTSKSRPLSPSSACSWSLSQRRSGAPEMNQSEPLSATISP